MANANELPEWTGAKLANGEFLGYSKAIYLGVEQLSHVEGEIGMTLATQAKKLFNVLSAYKGVHTHSLTKETEEFQGLEFDMQKNPEVAEAANQLGLRPWFDALSSANSRVDYLYSHRTGERSDRIGEAKTTFWGFPPRRQPRFMRFDAKKHLKTPNF